MDIFIVAAVILSIVCIVAILFITRPNKNDSIAMKIQRAKDDIEFFSNKARLYKAFGYPLMAKKQWDAMKRAEQRLAELEKQKGV